jgi:hypothetical protein
MLVMKYINPQVVIVLAIATVAIAAGSSCANNSADIEEVGQQIGDIMASIDESGGSSGGTLGQLDNGSARTFARLAPSELRGDWVDAYLLPRAYAATCLTGSSFSGCSSGVITRTFNSCTIGTATFSGSVTLTFSSAACTMNSVNDTVTRVPAFTVTGRRGATLTVSKTGSIGQRVTRTSASALSFSNDGIRRVFTDASGSATFDFTTQTTSAIGISGTSRADRVLSGGTLRVTNNLTGTTCDFSPTNVSWSSTCNCATSGSWSGSCSDGKTGKLTITGCGTATLVIGEESQAVTFDRCYGI